MGSVGREDKEAKAQRLLAQRRVFLTLPRTTSLGDVPPGALVLGETDVFQVWFSDEGVACYCFAGSDHGAVWPPRCSHGLAASIAWMEAGSDDDALGT